MTEPDSGHHLKKELRLRDLVQMQILLVVGVTWIGIAAKQGGTHLVFWLAAIATLFLPSAAVVTYCVQLWPEEGGVYQWTRHVFGPLAGFLNGWNFAMWAIISTSNLGIVCATSLAYSLGPALCLDGRQQGCHQHLQHHAVRDHPGYLHCGLQDRQMGLALRHPDHGAGEPDPGGAACSSIRMRRPRIRITRRSDRSHWRWACRC